MWAAYLTIGLVLAAAVAVLLGSAFLAAQSPAFWYGLGRLLLADLWPVIAGMVAKDLTDPEVDRLNKEAALRPAGPVHPGTGVTVRQEAATRRNRPKP